MLSEVIIMHQDKYSKSGESAKALGKRMFRTDEFFSAIPSFVQTKTMDGFADQLRVDLLGSMSMAISTRNEAAVPTEATLCTKHRLV